MRHDFNGKLFSQLDPNTSPSHLVSVRYVCALNFQIPNQSLLMSRVVVYTTVYTVLFYVMLYTVVYTMLCCCLVLSCVVFVSQHRYVYHIHLLKQTYKLFLCNVKFHCEFAFCQDIGMLIKIPLIILNYINIYTNIF